MGVTKDVVQIVMGRRAAMTINNLAALGYFVAMRESGFAVDRYVYGTNLLNAVSMLRRDIPANATLDDLQDAFNCLGNVPVKDGDNVVGTIPFDTQGIVDDGT